MYGCQGIAHCYVVAKVFRMVYSLMLCGCCGWLAGHCYAVSNAVGVVDFVWLFTA